MIRNETIWITGASSGIGKQLALQLAAWENRVYVSSRSQAALQRMADQNCNIIVCPCDVTDADSVRRAAQKISAISNGLDRVIINAGTCEYLDLQQPDWGMTQRVCSVNFFGAVNVFFAALPLLKAQRSTKTNPHVVAIASLVTAAPFPRAEVYGASKAALDYFFDAARIDLKKSAIDVSIVQPGFVATPLTAKNDFAMPFLISVESAVEHIIKVLQRRPHRYRFPFLFSIILRALALYSPLWTWIAINKLSRAVTGGHKE